MAEPDRTEQTGSGSRDGVLGRLRSSVHHAIPKHFQDPGGLALRILRSGNADAFSALIQAGAKLGLSPMDAVLSRLTRSISRDEAEPSRPVLFVTGPPRSGTTLLHQLLIRALPVAYLTNLASLFPQSSAAGAFPLAVAIFNDRVRTESYYGRTRALWGPSDGLEFWDRWLGADRRAIPCEITPSAAREMRRFFGHLERRSGRPVVAKNNNLLGSAHLVAEALPSSRFVCLRRDPLYLAQSLLKARRDIQGSSDVSYGLDGGDAGRAPAADPLADVWRQVRFYEQLESKQMRRLAGERFLVVSYEQLCADPASVVRQIGRDVFGFEEIAVNIEPLRPRRERTLAKDEFERLAKRRP